MATLEAAVIQNHRGGQPAEDDAAAGGPGVIQEGNAGVPDAVEVFFVQHPFMVAQGQEGRGDRRAVFQEGQDIFLRNQRGDVVRRMMPGNDIPRDGDDLRFVLAQAVDDRLEGPAVQVAQEGQGGWEVDGIGCFFHDYFLGIGAFLSMRWGTWVTYQSVPSVSR